MKTISLNRLSLAILMALFITTIWSCQKELSINSEPEVTIAEAQQTTEESTEAEASLDDVDDIAFTTAEEEGSASTDINIGGRHFLPSFEELRKRIGDCAIVTVSPNNETYPKTVVIDFGEGCIGRDGKFRKGKLELHFTAAIREPNSVVTLKYVDFFLNRASIKGKKIFKNNSSNGVHKFSIQAVGISVEYPNGRGYKYNGQKNVTQVAGMDTKIIRDDVYEIEGKATIVKGDGLNVHVSTKTVLTKKVACHWISKGILQIKIQNRVFLLDYGYPNANECDNKALLTWNDGQNEKIITLP